MYEIQVVVSEQLRDEYQRLLQEAWTLESLRDSLRLVRDILAASRLIVSFPWESGDQSSHGEHLQITRQTWEDLAKFSQKFFLQEKDSPFLRLVTTQFSNHNDLVQKAYEVSAALNLQTILYLERDAVLVGATDFLRDCQSMLLLVSLSELLPVIMERRLEESEALLEAYRLHIAQIWSDDLAQQAFLIGTVASQLESYDMATKAFRVAFRVSNPDDHDFLTKAHAVWFSLRDAGQEEEARHFLLNLLRSSPAEYLAEIEEMIKQQFSSASS